MRSMLPIWREAVERVVNRTAETRPEIPENTEKRPCLVQGSISAKLALALFCQIRQNCLTSDGSRGSGIGNPGIGGRESDLLWVAFGKSGRACVEPKTDPYCKLAIRTGSGRLGGDPESLSGRLRWLRREALTGSSPVSVGMSNNFAERLCQSPACAKRPCHVTLFYEI
jgi:hypothetical protein